jgi:uncharacterized protein with PIN domain
VSDPVSTGTSGTSGTSGEAAPPRFLVDHMLIKLGKYLRIVGLDAAYVGGVRTHELIARANEERRAFLTRNTRLADQYPPADRVLVLREVDPVAQLAAVLEAFGVDPHAGLFSRCIRCNVELEELAELAELGDDAAHVPPRVRARHERFWRCPACATVFWRGTHVENTCRKLGLRP